MITDYSDPTLLSESRRKFWGHIRATYPLGEHHQIRIIRDKGYPPRLRAAALRNLTCDAPSEVTMVRPYAERRRLVRKHYQV